MSSDIYIPLSIVLSHPGQFALEAALDGDIGNARQAMYDTPIDWDYVQGELRPLLLCKFGARETWRVVDIGTSDHNLHISCGGSFRAWLLHWLDDNGHPYIWPDDPKHRSLIC